MCSDCRTYVVTALATSIDAGVTADVSRGSVTGTHTLGHERRKEGSPDGDHGLIPLSAAEIRRLIGHLIRPAYLTSDHHLH
jgi:hypothetical protein